MESADGVDAADTDDTEAVEVLDGIVDLGSGPAAAVIGDLGCVVDEVAF